MTSWHVIADNDRGVDIFLPLQGPVTGSLTPAHEIEGMTRSKAVRELEKTYGRVWTHPAGEDIICYRDKVPVT